MKLALYYLMLSGPGLRPLAQAEDRVGAVDIVVIDAFGVVLPYEIASFKPVTRSTNNSSSRIHGLSVDAVPYGEYSYRLIRSDFPTLARITGTLTVDQAHIWRTEVYHGSPIIEVFGQPSQGDSKVPEGITITGVIHPLPKEQRKSWVRIQALYEQTAYDQPLNERGEFHLERFLQGNYLLLVFEGGNLLHTVPLVFRLGTSRTARFEVELPNSVPRALTVR